MSLGAWGPYGREEWDSPLGSAGHSGLERCPGLKCVGVACPQRSNVSLATPGPGHPTCVVDQIVCLSDAPGCINTGAGRTQCASWRPSAPSTPTASVRLQQPIKPFATASPSRPTVFPQTSNRSGNDL